MFTSDQLQLIEKAARSVKNQGEIAVYHKIMDGNYFGEGTLTKTQTDIVLYCAEECKRQHSGELSVYWMVNAWDFAQQYLNMPNMIPDDIKEFFQPPNEARVTLDFISHLGALVEPHKNIVRADSAFRRIPIGVTDGMGGWIEKAQWNRVPELLSLLLEAYYEGNLNPRDTHTRFGLNSLSKTSEDEFYYQYENIHPFVDGNGRTGKILYNYLLGRLSDPIMPPNFWDSSNP